MDNETQELLEIEKRLTKEVGEAIDEIGDVVDEVSRDIAFLRTKYPNLPPEKGVDLAVNVIEAKVDLPIWVPTGALRWVLKKIVKAIQARRAKNTVL